MPKVVGNKKTVMCWVYTLWSCAQLCYSIVAGRIWNYSAATIMAGVGFQRGNFEGNSQGIVLHPRARACMARKYQPRTQAFRSGFCLPALEKSNKSCETKPGTGKSCEQHRERKPWVRGYRVWVFLVVRCNRLELDCSWLNLDLWLFAISRGLSERKLQLVSTCLIP